MRFVRRHLEWFVSAGVGLVLLVAVSAFEWFNYEDQPTLLRMLCDGAFVAGALLTCFGAMVLVAAEGAFDAMGYAVHLLVRKFSPRKDRFASRITYLEYKARRKEKKRPSVQCVLVIGVAYLVLDGIFLALYYL